MLVKMGAYFDGQYLYARGVNEDIFTQGETYDELLKNIKKRCLCILRHLKKASEGCNSSHDIDFIRMASSSDVNHLGIIFSHPKTVSIGQCIRGGLN